MFNIFIFIQHFNSIGNYHLSFEHILWIMIANPVNFSNSNNDFSVQHGFVAFYNVDFYYL